MALSMEDWFEKIILDDYDSMSTVQQQQLYELWEKAVFAKGEKNLLISKVLKA